MVINPVPADHNLVTQVHQLNDGERRAAPLDLTPPGVFLAIAEGRLRLPPSPRINPVKLLPKN